MPDRSHLPIAVIYPTEDVLAAMPLERLKGMLRECDCWFENMDVFRAAIHTDAGRTEWNVLTRPDIARASAARKRLRSAMERSEENQLAALQAGSVLPPPTS